MQKCELGPAETGAKTMSTFDNASGSDIVHSESRTPSSQLVLGDFAPTSKVINVSSVKHRSPFRYPGGKTWLVPLVRRWLGSCTKPAKHLAEPFAGGAIIALSALFDRLTEKITLIERDVNVGSVWQIIVNGDAPELAKRIIDFNCTEANALKVLKNEYLPDDILSRAFATIVRNRVQRGGIMAPGASLMRNGENGRGVASRWYPETLRNRLLDLHLLHMSIQFHSGDGIKFIENNATNEDISWFIDPPYTVAGRRLYLHSDIDHEELFEATSKIEGRFMMTYDNNEQIRRLARKHHFEVAEVPMKNTHHAIMSELVISNDLAWL